MSSVVPCYFFVIKLSLVNFSIISVFSVLKSFYGLIGTVLLMLLMGVGTIWQGTARGADTVSSGDSD